MLLPPSRAPGERGALRVLDERESSARTALRFQRSEPQKFVDLARAMGIPSRDAARQVMEIMEARAMLSPCGSRINGR
jgi:hypothetical protein